MHKRALKRAWRTQILVVSIICWTQLRNRETSVCKVGSKQESFSASFIDNKPLTDWFQAFCLDFCFSTHPLRLHSGIQASKFLHDCPCAPVLLHATPPNQVEYSYRKLDRIPTHSVPSTLPPTVPICQKINLQLHTQNKTKHRFEWHGSPNCRRKSLVLTAPWTS